MAVSLIALQDAIAGLNLAGVRRIYTSVDAPMEVQARDLPVLMPDPAQWLVSSRNTRLTLGTLAAGASWTRARELNYVCLIGAAGAERAPGKHATELSTVLDAVENGLCDAALEGIHAINAVNVGAVGRVLDAAGNEFYGFPVSIAVTMTY